MAGQGDGVSEKAKKIEIALKYTGNDMEKAKFMAAGKLQDVISIKGKFVIPEQNQSGAFLAFVNVAQEYISAVKSVLTTNTGTYSRLRIFDDWKSLYNNLITYEKAGDAADAGKLTGSILDALIKNDVFPDVQKMNLEYLSIALQDMIKEIFKSDKAKCQVDLEKTSSMDLELIGIDVMVPEVVATQEPGAEPAAGEEKKIPDTPFKKKLGEIESKVSFIVEGCCVLSPVRGKPIREIVQGERILVSLSAGDPVSEKIIDAYKARDHEGKPVPIVGRVTEIMPNEEAKGVILYVLVAKGILAKIIEEEPVRIQTEMTQIAATNGNGEEDLKESGNWVTILVSILFVILIISLIVIIMVIT